MIHVSMRPLLMTLPPPACHCLPAPLLSPAGAYPVLTPLEVAAVAALDD
jgi:hypothetical protein